MSKFRFQLITVETDNPTPEVFAAIRKLIRRASLGGATVVTSVPAPPADVLDPSHPVWSKPGASPKPMHVPAAARPAAPVAAPPAPSPVAPARTAPPPAPERGATKDIRQVIEAGNTAAATPLSLSDRVLAAIVASPGVTAGNLLTALSGPGVSRTGIYMTLSNLQAAGQVMRANGQLFPRGYRGPVAAPAPARAVQPTAPSAGATDAATKERIYGMIIRAFKADNFYSIPKLAEECFGEATGIKVRTLKLMIHQLVLNEKLERMGEGEYRPFTKKAEPGAEEDDSESNGQPDEDDEEELV